MRCRTGLLAVAATLSLAACDSNPDETAALCPKPYLVPDATTLTRYRGAGRDLSELVLSAKLTDVKGACSGTIGTKLEGAHAHVVMVVTRGPAATASEADVAYGVGLLLNGEILREAHYVQHVVFPPNVSSVQVTGREVPMSLPTSKTVSGPSYHLYFWLQLTPEQLAENRRKS